MRTVAIFLILVGCSAFYIGFKAPTDDIIVTAIPKGYAPPRPMVRPGWEDSIPKIEEEAPAAPVVAVKQPLPPPAAMPAGRFMLAKKGQPVRRQAKARRLTRISYPLKTKGAKRRSRR